jgi:hypothetical protein
VARGAYNPLADSVNAVMRWPFRRRPLHHLCRLQKSLTDDEFFAL